MFDFLFGSKNLRERKFKEDGFKIIGSFRGEIPESNFTFENKNYKYTGPYISNFSVTQGTLKYYLDDNIFKYEGDIMRVDGRLIRHGYGKLTLNGQIITGHFNRNELHGDAKIYYQLFGSAEVTYHVNKIVSFSYINEHGDRLNGTIIDENKNIATGSIETHNGNIFEGEFRIYFPSSKLYHQSHFYYESGNLGISNSVIMNGKWTYKNQELLGAGGNPYKLLEFNGKVIYPNGDFYEGSVVLDKFKTGKFVRNETQYDGEWEFEGNDVKFKGNVLYPNKNISYHGEMLNYMKHGAGTLKEKTIGLTVETYCYNWNKDVKDGEGYVIDSNEKLLFKMKNGVETDEKRFQMKNL